MMDVLTEWIQFDGRPIGLTEISYRPRLAVDHGAFR